MTIGAGEFKAKCLKLMDQVAAGHGHLIVTKRGKPVVKVIPVRDKPERPLFGYLRGSVSSQGDIVSPIGEIWHADQGE